MGKVTAETAKTAHRSTVIVTRPKDDAAPLIDLLRDRGHEVIAFPVLGIEPVGDAHALATTMARIADYRLVVFVSPNAIRHAIAQRTAAWPRDVTIAVMGPGSIAALEALGIGGPDVDLVSPPVTHSRPGPRHEGQGIDAGRDPAFDQRYDSEALLAALDAAIGLHAGFEGRVLIVRGNGGRAWFADRLRERGIAVDEVESYRRVRPEPDAACASALRRLFGDRVRVHVRAVFIVTSSEGLVNLVAMVESLLGSEARSWLFDSRIVTPHARIAEKARRMGFSRVSLAESGDRGIVAAIE